MSLFRYTTAGSKGDSNATWTVTQPGPGACQTTQMLTARVGDYMTFKYTVSQPRGRLFEDLLASHFLVLVAESRGCYSLIDFCRGSCEINLPISRSSSQGTSVIVIGTVGVPQGIINFALDGQNITTFDRGRVELACDQVIFQQMDLPWGEHTVVATLVGKGTNPQTGQLEGILSVQRVV